MSYQFIIPWLTLCFALSRAQRNSATIGSSSQQSFPGVDPLLYQQFLANQARINKALLINNPLLSPAAAQNLVTPEFAAAHQAQLAALAQNAQLSHGSGNLFVAAPFPRAPHLFDPLTGAPLPNMTPDQLAHNNFNHINQMIASQNEALIALNTAAMPLGGIHPLPIIKTAAIKAAKTVTEATTVASVTTTEAAEGLNAPVDEEQDTEQLRLIRKLLEETLAGTKKTKEETPSTTPKSTTTHEPTTVVVPKENSTTPAAPALESLSVFDKLNLSESEKRAIVNRVEQLLRAEITKKLREEGSPLPSHPHRRGISKTTATDELASHEEMKKKDSTTAPTPTTQPATTMEQPKETTAVPTTKTTPPLASTTPIPEESSTYRPLSPEDLARIAAELAEPVEQDSATEKTTLKSLEQKQQKKRPETRTPPVDAASTTGLVLFSESIDEAPKFRVNSVQKEIREAQPRLPTRYAYNSKQDDRDGQEDLDLITRGNSQAASSLLTSARRIRFPQEYEEKVVAVPVPAPVTPQNFFQPATGAPLDLYSAYDDDEGLVDLDVEERRRERERRLRTTTSPVPQPAREETHHDEDLVEIVDVTTPVASVVQAEVAALPPIETVTTPSFRNGRQHVHQTKFEALARDFQGRLTDSPSIALFLKKFYENAYIALIDRTEYVPERKLRHESRRRRRV